MGDAEFSLTLKAFTIQVEGKTEKQATRAQPYLFQMKFEMFLFCGKNKNRSTVGSCGPLFCLKIKFCQLSKF